MWSSAARSELAQGGFSFTGPADIASADPRLLLRWLDGRDNPPPEGPAKSMRLRADVSLGGEKIALERLRAEIDRKTVEGRLVYLWPSDGHKARLDAELNAAELDIDSVLDFAQAALGGTQARPARRSLARHRYRPRHHRRDRGAQRQCQTHLRCRTASPSSG